MSGSIAIILSGCGVHDGSDAHEVRAALVAVSSAGYQPMCFAPNKPQFCETDHVSGKTFGETSRSCLVEAARISWRKIRGIDVKSLNT